MYSKSGEMISPKKERKAPMSPKELLYIEDALGHEKQIKSLCKTGEEQLFDPELRNLFSEMAQRHSECFSQFYQLLN